MVSTEVNYRNRVRSPTLTASQIYEYVPSSMALQFHSLCFRPVSSALSPTSGNKADPELLAPSEAYQRGIIGRSRITTRLKNKIFFVSLANATASWLVTVIGYFVMVSKDESSTRSKALKSFGKGVVIFLSLLQITLMITTRKLRKQYWRGVDAAYRIGQESVLSLNLLRRPRSSKFTWIFVLECAFHLIVFLPNFSFHFSIWVGGVNSDFALDDVLFVMMSLRNYHTVEAAYWGSLLSSSKSYFVAKLVSVRVTNTFLYRCFMAIYTKEIVITIVTLIVLLPGLIEYLFGNIYPIHQFYSIWTEYWIISVTQAPVGYGDSSADTLFGQISLLASCFTGLILLGLTTSVSSNNLNLTLKECNLYSELLYTRGKERYLDQAGVLIQRWWRLMRMRAVKKRESRVIIEFYRFLGDYKKVIIECQRMRDHRFERQISAFERVAYNSFRPLSDYLIPLRDAYEIVLSTQAQDLVRLQYRLSTRILTLYEKVPKSSRLAGRLLSQSIKISPKQMRRKLPEKVNSVVCNGKRQNVSGQGMAIARGVACRNVKGRLIGLAAEVGKATKRKGKREAELLAELHRK